MSGIYCLCNHSAEAHGLARLEATGGPIDAHCYVRGCRCTVFEEDPTFEPVNENPAAADTVTGRDADAVEPGAGVNIGPARQGRNA